MTRFKFIVFLGVLLGLLTFSCGMPAISHAEPEALCPVLSNKIDNKVFVDYQGKRIYFCCQSCIAQFNKDPKKYLEQMEAKGVTPGKTP